MILDGSESSFSRSLYLLDAFASISGLKVNYDTLSQSSVFFKDIKQVHVVMLGKEQRGTLTNVKSVRLRQNNRAKKILTPLVVIFTVTMLPLNIFRLTVAFWPAIARQECFKYLLYAVEVSSLMNSSANPVMYSVVSRSFRKGLSNLALAVMSKKLKRVK